MSTRDRNSLRKLRRYSGRLNRMIEDGSLESLPARKRARLIHTVRSLYDGLLGVVSEATLHHILAAAAVVVLGVAGCARSTDIGSDVSPDPGPDTVADTTGDTIPETIPDPGWDPDADPGWDPDADPGTDPDADTITDPDTDSSTDPVTDPGSLILFDTVESNPFGFVGTSVYLMIPAPADVDGDGDIDLFVGTYDYYGGGSLVYYQNTGTAGTAAFASALTNPFGLTTSGYITAPAIADLDGDGDVDILATNYDYSSRRFLYYQNTGSATSPSFAAPTTNPFGLSAPTGWVVPITFVDVDGDGDMDLFSGHDWSGALGYYENTGTSSSPTFAAVRTNHFGFLGSGYLSAPAFADLDEDSDFDLMVGTYSYSGYSGTFKYYQNTGTATAAALAAPRDNPFGLTTTGSYYLFPAFADMDNDGDQDLFAGSSGSTLYYFENITP